MSVSYPQTTPIGVKFTWDTTSEQAAQLIAEGNLRHNVIASELQIGMSTINSWKRHPEFKMRVDFHLDRLRQEIGARGIALKHKRIDALQELWERMDQIVRERSQDPEFQKIPGGKSGLLTKTMKQTVVRNGPGRPPVIRKLADYKFDKDLVEQLCKVMLQTAKEVDQWVDRKVVDVREESSGLAQVLRQRLERLAESIRHSSAADSGSEAGVSGESEPSGAAGAPLQLEVLASSRPDAPTG